MKKIIFLSMMVLVLAAGSAYTGESTAWALTESGNLPHNGITVFSASPADFDNIPVMAATVGGFYEEGSAAGGWRGEEAMTELYPYNGVTLFSERSLDFETVPLTEEAMIGYEEGAAAGGLHEEAVALLENGITIFSTEPVDYEQVRFEAGW